MSERAGRRRTAPRCDGTSVSSHQSQATCYPPPAKLCFLIKSIVKKRLARPVTSLSGSSRPFRALSRSLLARRVTKESAERSSVNRGSGPKQGAIQIYSAIARSESYLSYFCPVDGFFSAAGRSTNFMDLMIPWRSLGSNDFRVMRTRGLAASRPQAPSSDHFGRDMESRSGGREIWTKRMATNSLVLVNLSPPPALNIKRALRGPVITPSQLTRMPSP